MKIISRELNMSDCPADKIIYDEARGEYICTETGEVLEERVATDLGKSDAVGIATALSHDYGITSIIRGRARTTEERVKLVKMARYQRQTRFYDKTLITVMRYIENIAYNLNLPMNIIITAISLARDLRKYDYFFRDPYLVSAALIYLSCRINKYPILPIDISNVIEKDKKEMIRKSIEIAKWLRLRVPPQDPRIYIKYVQKKIELPTDVVSKACELLDKINHPGTKAESLVAAALYLASKQQLNIKMLSRVLDIEEATIRSKIKELLRRFNKLR